MDEDVYNVYVVLSARTLSRQLFIVGRANAPIAEARLKRAGANRIISLYETGAAKMVQQMANPRVEDFFEVVTAKGKSLDLAEVQVAPAAPYAGLELAQSGFLDRGIRRFFKRYTYERLAVDVALERDVLAAKLGLLESRVALYRALAGGFETREG